MVILDIKKPKKCIWYEDGQDCKCPLLDDNDCCRGQGNEANSAANDWDDLMKGCPIKGEISEIELMHLAIFFREEERAFVARNIAAERNNDEHHGS